jgi:preprotein translocase subunit SecA
MVTRAIERAQKQVEAQNFGVRKHLLEYDDVMNKQRESVYTLRREILDGHVHLTEDEVVDTKEYLLALAEEILEEQVDRFAGKALDVDEHDIPALIREISRIFGVDTQTLEALELEDKSAEEVADTVWALIKTSYTEKETLVGGDLLRRIERDIMLQIVDAQWKDHLYSLDHLKEGIGLRGYGQRDPLVEYKKESYGLFQDMKARIEEEMVRYLFWLRPVINEGAEAPGGPPPSMPTRPAPRRPSPSSMTMNNPAAEAVPAFAGAARSSSSSGGRQAPTPARTGGDDVIKTVKRDEPKVGRNDPCPCGSGKKYKKCHGAGSGG